MARDSESTVHAFFECWSRQDAEGLAALFLSDADFVNVLGIWRRNARAIRKAHAYGFERIFPNAKLNIEDLTGYFPSNVVLRRNCTFSGAFSTLAMVSATKSLALMATRAWCRRFFRILGPLGCAKTHLWSRVCSVFFNWAVM